MYKLVTKFVGIAGLIAVTSLSHAGIKYAQVDAFIPTQSDYLTTTDYHYSELNKLSNSELKRTVQYPTGSDYVTVKKGTMELRDGHTRVYLLKKRGLGNLVIPYDEYSSGIKYYDE